MWLLLGHIYNYNEFMVVHVILEYASKNYEFELAISILS